jgi:DNA polymerase alpha subunit B
MFSPLHERSAELRDRLEEMVGALGAGAAVPAEAMTIGRICAEAEASRINTASVSLELAGGGGVMKLDLREVPRFAVFPGQIVGVQGASTGADRLAVTDLHTGGAAPYARMPMANARALARVRGKGGPTRVWVAAGPFTDPKDMNFEPLLEFLAEATQAEEGWGPNVLVLQGPFVDADHPLIRSTVPEAIDRVSELLVPSTFKEVWLSGAWRLGWLWSPAAVPLSPLLLTLPSQTPPPHTLSPPLAQQCCTS